MIGFNNVVQVFDLSMHRHRRAYAFLFQGGNGGAIGWRLIGIDDPRVDLSFHPVEGFA